MAIADLAARLAEVAGATAEVPRDPAAFSERSTELLAGLVQSGKSDALQKLGEGERALDIAEVWMRTQFSRARERDQTVGKN